MATAVEKTVATQRRPRECRTGTVVSDKGEKTIRVRFDYTVKHSKYRKYFRRSTMLHAHDEQNEARMGDLVEVMSCRPISKLKCWRLMRVVRRKVAVD